MNPFTIYRKILIIILFFCQAIMLIFSSTTYAIDCPSDLFSCNFSGPIARYNGSEISSQSPAGSAFGTVTANYEYACRFPPYDSSMKHYLSLALATESSHITGDIFATSLDGVSIKAGKNGIINGTRNRIFLDNIGPMDAQYSDTCWRGSEQNILIGTLIKSSDASALQPGTHAINFRVAPNYITSRYNIGEGYFRIIGPFPDSQITVSAPVCTALVPDSVIAFGDLHLSDLGNSLSGRVGKSQHLSIPLECSGLYHLGYQLDSVGERYIDKGAGIIGLQGNDTAQGIGYRVIDSNQEGKTVTFGTPALIQHDGSANLALDFEIQPMRTSGEVRPGTANAQMIMTFSYP